MQTKTIKNGLQVIAHSDPRLKNSVVNVLYKVGSANEIPEQTGLAHFLEHMAFEGSETYPNFDETLNEFMGENNAFTSQDYTCYYESFPNEYLEDILNIECDRVQNLSLNPKDISLQRKVIEEEYKETSINPPLSDAWHYLQALCFNNSYSWPVIGKELKHIKDMKEEIVSSFYQAQYSPENIILGIVSPLREEEIFELSERIFSKINSNNLPKNQIDISEKSKINSSKTLKRKNISNPHFFLAFHIADFGEKDYFLADMMSDLLTNGESSILYQELITDLQFCSEVNSYTTDNKHCNLLIIEGRINESIDPNKVIERISTCIETIKSEGITEQLFQKLHNKAMSYWAFYHYNPTQLVQNMCFFNYCQSVENPIEWIDRMYQDISKSDLERFINEKIEFKKASQLVYLPDKS